MNIKTMDEKEIKRGQICIKEFCPDTIYEQQVNEELYNMELKNGFTDFGICKESIRSIKELGFTKPTPIQVQSIPVLKNGTRDFIGLAQTGTGKTAAFGLPLIELLDLDKKIIQALILAPTRELCIQISNDLESYCKYLAGLSIVPVYGGASIEIQINKIKKGAQVVVATPGRLNDLIRRKKIDLSTIKYVILDEADEMLNMGFQEDIDSILAFTPKDKKTWLFAATMPDEIYAIIGKYMNDPFEITAGIKNAGADNIEHIYYVVHERDRYTALKRILDVNPEIFAIIFCRTRIETQEIAEKLIKDEYNADSLHGDLNQVQRDKVMKHYREKNLQLLVATDVAARGLDVDNVSHVINYQLPDEMEIYTHRSGRTARAGKSGITISIINTKDMGKLRYIEKHINKKFVYSKVPGGVEVCEQQLLALMKRIRKVEINQPGIEKYLPAIMSELKDIDKAELITRMVSLEFNRFLDYYRNAEDLNIDFSRKDHSRGRNNNNDAVSTFINLGTIDGFNNARMLKYFKEITAIPPDAFKRINIKGVYSFVDIKPEYLAGFIEAFDNEVFKGRKVRVDSSERSRSKKNFAPGSRKNFKKSKSRRMA